MRSIETLSFHVLISITWRIHEYEVTNGFIRFPLHHDHSDEKNPAKNKLYGRKDGSSPAAFHSRTNSAIRA